MTHLIQLLIFLRKQGYSHAELVDLFTIYFPSENYQIDDICEYFDIEITGNNIDYIENALPKVESALSALIGIVA